MKLGTTIEFIVDGVYIAIPEDKDLAARNITYNRYNRRPWKRSI